MATNKSKQSAKIRREMREKIKEMENVEQLNTKITSKLEMIQSARTIEKDSSKEENGQQWVSYEMEMQPTEEEMESLVGDVENLLDQELDKNEFIDKLNFHLNERRSVLMESSQKEKKLNKIQIKPLNIKSISNQKQQNK